MRTPSIDRASSTRRAAWLLAGAAALSAAPAACSHDAPGTAAENDAPPATPEIDAAASAKLAAIRARFPAALAANEGVRARDDAAAGAIQIDLPASAKRAATLDLPRRADGAIHLTDTSSHLQIAFSLEGAAPARAAIDGGVVLYAGAAPGGGDVIHVPSAAGTEDLIHFDRAPAKEHLSYRVDVSQAAGLRLFARTLELLDAAGTPLLRVAPPYVLDAEGQRHEAELELDGCAADTSALAPFGRPVTSPGAAFCTVSVDWHAAHVAYPALVDPSWGITLNTLVTPRLRHTITLLNPSDPKSLALLAGGFATVGGAALKSAEIYDPLSRRFTSTGPLAVARGSHTATLLSKVAKPTQLGSADPVLVAGGADSAGTPLATLEIYDPSTGLFQTDPTPMASPRFGHSATLFADRKVLLAGGTTLPLNQPTPTAALYTLTSLVGGVLTSAVATTASPMKNSRTGLASARLGTGQVLLTGGFVLAGGSLQALQSAEIYDPTSNAFLDITPANNGIALMAIQRGGHTATPIGGGLTLIAGGTTNTVAGTFPTAIDIYSDGSLGGITGFLNPGSLGNLTTGRASHTATVLASGDVLIAGGFNAGSSISAAEVFATKTKTFSPLGTPVPMAARGDHAALLVNAGDTASAGHTVLVTGGATSSTNGATALASAEILHNDNGDPCGGPDECASGFCADGVCCNTACDALCYACSTATQQANGKNVNGTCGYSLKGSDTQVQCINELEIHTQCNGAGSPEQAGTTKDCKPGTCDAKNQFCVTTCKSTSECSVTGFCDLTDPNAGVCSPRRVDSTICAADEECFNGHCVDGLCCDLACDGQCQACDVPGFPGKCTVFGTAAVPEQPHPNTINPLTSTKPRAACDGVIGGKATSCTGYCVGAMDPIHCQDPGTSVTLQGTTCADAAGAASKLTSYPCDGKGANTEVATDCGGFLCADAATCKTTCAADAECLPDFVCTDKACQALTGPLCDGGNILRRPAAQGGNTPCADHYTCPAAATACRTDCDSINDCVDGLVCNGDRTCVTRPAAAVITACNVGQPGDAPPRSLPWTLSLAALAALAIFRRRTA